MQVLEFLSSNYLWFLVGAIVILLAIIGYVADKTNFGQGKNDESNKKNIDLERLNSMGIDQLNAENLEKEQQLEIQEQPDDLVQQNEFINANDITTNINNDINLSSDNQDENKYNLDDVSLEETSQTLEKDSKKIINGVDLSDFFNSTETLNKKIIDNDSKEVEVETVLLEEKMENFDKEFDLFLPEKEVIDSNLLEDIDDLNFDKTQKLDFGDIESLSNIELPNIKNVKKEDHDIWKF